MCFPENDIPKDILCTEIGPDEIKKIAMFAHEIFEKKIKETLKNIDTL